MTKVLLKFTTAAKKIKCNLWDDISDIKSLSEDRDVTRHN